MGTLGRTAVPLALAAGLLAGCGASVRASDVTESGRASSGAARSGGTVGAAGSGCTLPVTFDTARGWRAEAVEGPAGAASDAPGGDLAESLLRQGPVTLVCEIDAKPAGAIGFLRVSTGKPGRADAGAVLRAFVAAQAHTGGARYRTFTSGGLAGVRVDYVSTSGLSAESKRESALAVVTPDGPVVLHLGGLDSEEHDEMLPAFELARRTLRTA
ncbi:lipoprotein [Streptomyces sp. NPDC001068]|uniref:lipoprotein n=1 Tax=Streptomyces sp. NPDC001068 TaxID=3364544 RepID=UPI0036765D4F